MSRAGTTSAWVSRYLAMLEHLGQKRPRAAGKGLRVSTPALQGVPKGPQRPGSCSVGRAHGHNAAMATRLVFLVPGFFGFTSVGTLSYFEDVEQILGRALRRRGVEARIVRCTTQPTGSIKQRADALRREVLRKGGLKAQELHFVGHSTGGLDVRMLLTPGAKLARGDTEERIARLTRTAISVATPHHGTPLANHFITVHGQTLLLVLTALATSGEGRGTLFAAAKAIALVARLDDWLGRSGTSLDRIAEGLLRKIRFDREDPAWKYLGEIERDQGAILQLTPEGIDMFDAAVADHVGIAYSCVVAGVPTPHEEFKVKDLMDPEYLVLRSLFRLLHALTAQPHPHYPYPKPTKATQRLLDHGLRFKATPAISDGIVPTLSQLHGRLLHVARADHLDVVGHYTLAGGRTGNWLPSGAGFNPDAFEATWEAVAAEIARRRRPARTADKA
jgi:triacylglycerol lipase